MRWDQSSKQSWNWDELLIKFTVAFFASLHCEQQLYMIFRRIKLLNLIGVNLSRKRKVKNYSFRKIKVPP